MGWTSTDRRRLVIRALPLVIVVAGAVACSDDGGEDAGSPGSPTEVSDPAGSSASTQDPITSSTADSPGADTTASATSTSTPGGSTTPAPASGPRAVRVGPVTIERTDPCPGVTVAPTFLLTMTSDAGVETVPHGDATQVDVAEGSPTAVGPDATFTVAGAWSLNVQMLEHLSGATRGTTHTGTSRLIDEISIDGAPIDISWTVTEQGDQVQFTQARFAISPSCVQIQPGTLVTVTGADGTATAVGSTDPAFPQPLDLPLGQPVTVFDGAVFEDVTSAGWAVEISVIEHWNGRFHHSPAHTAGGSVTAPVAGSNPGDTTWEIAYTIEGP